MEKWHYEFVSLYFFNYMALSPSINQSINQSFILTLYVEEIETRSKYEGV